MKKNQILITAGTDYKKITKEILEEADLQSHIMDRTKKIGINLKGSSKSGAAMALSYWFQKSLFGAIA